MLQQKERKKITKTNDLISKKYKEVCRALNYIELLLVSASTVTRYVSISFFASLVGISICIANNEAELKIYLITAAIKNHKSIIKKSLIR